MMSLTQAGRQKGFLKSIFVESLDLLVASSVGGRICKYSPLQGG